ncbi:MAG TPA: FAD:protein FMN transferase [Gammaproteobacteria bacterium]
MADLSVNLQLDYCSARFRAMAGPCEVLIDSLDINLARQLGQLAQQEAVRIENKFSRYRDGNDIYRINHANGEPVEVDTETADLLDYAGRCYEISGGLFDITSGILRHAWRFDGSGNIPSQQQIDALLPHIGWEKVRWQRPVITMQPGMELDLGGIGKEYAVDRSVKLLRETHSAACLVNFGGDIAVSGPRRSGAPWIIGVEHSGHAQPTRSAGHVIRLQNGAVATSGDTKRYLLKDGIRYSHILNPKTGWAVTGAPRSVTVTASTCTEAGILSTLALLQGADAEQFLKQQEVDYCCEW